MMKAVLHSVVFLFVAVLVLAQGSVSWKDLQTNIDSWARGPVSLIMTSEEQGVFSKLNAPEEKLQFIKIFWSRRDPVLRTRQNEFKDKFYEWVDYANKNFEEKNTTGWQSARGQAYIIFGPPSRVDHQSIPDSSRPALLWVYDKLLSKHIPANEALMFVWRDFKYVLAPPNPGDPISAQQASIDRSFRYQSIPSVVEQAFHEVSTRNVVDEDKDYEELLFSVKSTEKFGIASLNFDTRVLESAAPQMQISIPADTAPVYDDGNRTFAELIITQEYKQGDRVTARKEQTQSFTWSSEEFGELKEINVKLEPLPRPDQSSELFITVQDRISSVSETKKVQ